MQRLVASLILCSAAAFAADRFSFADWENDRIEVRENGKPVLVYNYGQRLKPGAPADRQRCCYLYPVYTPAGVNVLDDFPADHYHHRGVFWAWPVVKTSAGTVDLWTLKGAGHRFERWLEQEYGDTQASLTMENGWYAGGKKIVSERVHIMIRPSTATTREFTITLTLQATDQLVTIQGSPDQRKGYGGVSARFAPRTETVIRTSEGELKGDEDHGEHEWAELEAAYDGKRAALRITADRSNPGTPNEWCLRQYGFVGANYPGVRPLALEPGQPVTLKYRITLRDSQ